MPINPLQDSHFFFRERSLPRNVAIAIEGGGSTSILLLGQLKHVRERLGWNIFTYSGASAGAMIAALEWSGLAPTEIEDRFCELAETKGLSSIVSDEINPFSSNWLSACGNLLRMGVALIVNSVLAIFGLAMLAARGVRNFAVSVLLFLWSFSFPDKDQAIAFRSRRSAMKSRGPIWSWLPWVEWRLPGKLMIEIVDKWIREGLEKRGIHSELLSFAGCGKHVSFRDVRAALDIIDAVQEVKSTDDSLVKAFVSSRRLRPEQLADIKFDLETKYPLKRNNILDIVFGKETAKAGYVPPLWISITDIAAQRELVANNVDDNDFQRIPIAKLVRASAGHPALFRNFRLDLYSDTRKRRPWNRAWRLLRATCRAPLGEGSNGRTSNGSAMSWLPWERWRRIRATAMRIPRAIERTRRHYMTTDGGVILNFPIGVFGAEMRKKLAGSPSYAHLSAAPYVTLGLRWVYRKGRDTLPLATLVFGGARTRLEDQISEGLRRHYSLKQPKPRHMPGLLHFHRFNSKTIRQTVRLGEAFARRQLARSDLFLRIRSGDAGNFREEIVNALSDIDSLWALSEAQYSRIIAYVLTSETRGGLERAMAYCSKRPAASFKDNDAKFEGGEEGIPGLVGLCLHYRLPVVARLDLLREQRLTSPDHVYLGRTEGEASGMPEDANVAILVPIFDYDGLGMVTPRKLGPGHQDPKGCFSIAQSTVGGPILGVVVLQLGLGDALTLPPNGRGAAAKLLESRQTLMSIGRLERLAVTCGHIIARRSATSSTA